MIDTVVMYAEPLVAKVKARIKSEVISYRTNHEYPPKLVALLIGDEPVSRTYVDLKRKDCEEVGIISETIDLSSNSLDSFSETVVAEINRLNSDRSVSGVIPQLPFSGKVPDELVFGTLSPSKDIDGLTPFNMGKLLRKEYDIGNSLLPCTPKGIVLLLEHYGVPLEGADVAIVGRSTLVSEPLRKLLQDRNATATCFHTYSKNVEKRLSEADIVVVASGRPPEIFGKDGFRLTGDMVKEGSTVVGVGTTRHNETGKMLFDVDTKSLKGKCSFVTPNTGGVGTMTRLALIQNTMIAASRN